MYGCCTLPLYRCMVCGAVDVGVGVVSAALTRMAAGPVARRLAGPVSSAEPHRLADPPLDVAASALV